MRLQPINLRAPWEKGSCVAKVGPRSYLIEADTGQLYRRNRKFIRPDHSEGKPQSQSYAPPVSTPVKSDVNLGSPSQQSTTVPKFTSSATCKDTEVETVPAVTTPVSYRATVTRSGRQSIAPKKFNDFIT